MRTGVERVRDSPLLMGLALVVVAALGALLADTVTTVVLFAVLTPFTLVMAVFVGIHMLNLSEGAPRSLISRAAVVLGVLGPAAGTLVVNIKGMHLAGDLTGATFWVPLAALAVNVLLVACLVGFTGFLVRVFR